MDILSIHGDGNINQNMVGGNIILEIDLLLFSPSSMGSKLFELKTVLNLDLLLQAQHRLMM